MGANSHIACWPAALRFHSDRRPLLGLELTQPHLRRVADVDQCLI